MLVLLLSSFIIGGALVALFSFMAEQADKDLAGMILSFPSTLIVSLYFMWQVLAPEAYAQAAITMYVSLALSLVVVFSYIKAFELSSKISVALLASMSVWAGTSYLVLLWKPDDSWTAAVFYTFVLILMHKVFALHVNAGEIASSPSASRNDTRSSLRAERSNPSSLRGATGDEAISYTTSQKIMRIILAGTVISLGVFFAKTLGPVWGGIFTMFPAAYIATLIAYSEHYDHKFMYRAFSNSPLGSVSLIIYIVASIWAFPLWGELWGSLAAILASALYVLAFHVLRNGR